MSTTIITTTIMTTITMSIAAAAITMTTMMTMMKTIMSIIMTMTSMTTTTRSTSITTTMGHCCCGHHHHDHDADEVFTSWGVETAKKFSKADIEHALTELDTGNYGMILRSKGIVDGGADGWLEFDYVPGEWEVRSRSADVGGKLVVIGSKLNETAIAQLFGC